MTGADHPRKHCGVCGEVEFTAKIIAIVVWAPGLAEPLNLSPNDEFRLCSTMKCDAAWIFAAKSAVGNPLSREAGEWTMAAFTFADGKCFTIRAQRREVLRA